VQSLALRPVTASQLEASRSGVRDTLFTTTWVPVPAAPAAEPEPAQTVIVGEAVLAAPGTPGYPDLAALAVAVAAGQPAPQTVLACSKVTFSSVSVIWKHRLPSRLPHISTTPGQQESQLSSWSFLVSARTSMRSSVFTGGKKFGKMAMLRYLLGYRILGMLLHEVVACRGQRADD